MLNFMWKHPFLSQLLLAFLITWVLSLAVLVHGLLTSDSVTSDELLSGIVLTLVMFVAFALLATYPLIILVYQIIVFIQAIRWRSPQPHRPAYDTWVLIFLLGCTMLYLSAAKETVFEAGWQDVLRNFERHSPIAPDYYPVFFLLFLVCLAAFYLLWIKPVNEIPPLAAVLAMAVLYISTIYVLLWTVHIFVYQSFLDLYLLLPAAVFLLIVARTITITVKSYTFDSQRATKLKTRPVLQRLNTLMKNSKNWPIFAFLMLLPILGIIYGFLLLLGQGPHALIQAFTETSDWNLSQQVSPPNVQYDEHYLCTVAACGHASLVKPLRGGVRHGHTVVVNRQLQVANAFEQVISDNLPGLHRMIRTIYDQYGFDLANRVKSKWAADLVWVLMKPLEWFFLLVIYLFVPHPEDLIAMQYTGKRYSRLEDLASL